VTYTDVKEWVSRLARTRGPATVRRAHNVLSMVLADAVRDGRLVKNPAEGVPLPRKLRKQRTYLTHGQVHTLAACADDFGAVVLVLAYTGLRWGELAALKVGRVDTAKRRIDVVENVVDIGGHLTWGTPKTHESRSVPFPPFLVPLFEEPTSGKGPDGLVFVGARGGVLRHNVERRRHFDPAAAIAGSAVSRLQASLGMPDRDVDGIFGPRTERALREWQVAHGLAPTGRTDRAVWVSLEADNRGNAVERYVSVEISLGARDFPRLTPHDLRPTAASLAVSAGANVKAIQRMLGHASAAMTLDTYADLFDDDLDAVAIALGEAASQQGVGKMWAREAEPH